ncbi:hypothetical protein FA13DRAFT_1813370 [Coprinellus micaceus]|uniref:Uncharacterized protein n=1 Tax=Coprinellus micaceus TaxID=71717 RepID=A0A4Y7TG04_COPMI|nr:hypothetical protein FA13DRAFT_1813370 [Coprinellus micaceus]
MSSLGLGGESSLRPMTDPSDASFSFQIPSARLGDDYLLEYEGGSFLKGADNIPATPAPSSRFTLEPLTINDLTPRPSKSTHSSLKPSPKQIRSRSPPTDAQRTPSRRTSSRIQAKAAALSRHSQDSPVPQSPRGERIDALKAQLDSLTEELGDAPKVIQPESPKAPTASSRQKLRRREGSIQRKESAKAPTVCEGGIAKVRLRRGARRSLIPQSAASALAQATLHSKEGLSPISASPRQSPVAESTDNPGPSVGSEPSYNVVTELMVPRENPTDAHVPIIAEPSTSRSQLGEPSQVAEDMNVAAVELSTLPVVADHSPLTVSQLSPQKPVTSWGASAELDNDAAVESAVDEAPFRTSSKRPVSVEDSGKIEGARARKKSKLDPSGLSSSIVPSSSKQSAPALLTNRLPPVL